jgi:topoisomerase-4 subunit A
MVHIEKWNPDHAISAVYYDAEKDLHFVKRFHCEVTIDKKVLFISESVGSYLDTVSTAYRPNVRIVYNKLLKETKNLPDNEVNIADFIEIKGMKAQGNQLTKLKVKEIILTHAIEGAEPWPDEIQEVEELDPEAIDGVDVADGADESTDDGVPDGTTVEWDLTKKDDEDQMTLF